MAADNHFPHLGPDPSTRTEPEIPKKQRAGGQAILMLIMCFVLGMLSRGMFDSILVLLRPLDQSFDVPRDVLTGIHATAMLTTGLAAPFAGRAYVRFGPRLAYTLGVFALGAGLFLSGSVGELWALYLGHGVLVGLGSATLGNVVHAILISRWFDRRRGTALGFVHSAMGAGVLVMSPLTQTLVDIEDWRFAYTTLAICGTAIMLPIALFMPWNRLMDGPFAPGKSDTGNTTGADADGMTLTTALRGWPFWALAAAYLTTGVGIYIIVTQIVDYLQTVGLNDVDAAWYYGVAAGLAPVGMVSFGALGDRIGILPAVMLSYGMTIISYFCFVSLADHLSLPILLLALISLGLTLGSRGPMISSLASRYYQGKSFGAIHGTILLGGGLGAAIGAWIGGRLFDIAGGHLPLFWIGAAVLVFGSLLFVPLTRNLPR